MSLATTHITPTLNRSSSQEEELKSLPIMIDESWALISPWWPLKHLIAVNPLQGFEDLPFETALKKGSVYFEAETLPPQMQAINRVTIKWLQILLDENQSTIGMPLKNTGMYQAWKSMAVFDTQLHKKHSIRQTCINSLSDSPQSAIAECLLKLSIPKEKRSIFLTLMLTTLPGWAGYIQYLAHHNNAATEASKNLLEEYLAIRLIITSMMWPSARLMLDWHQNRLQIPTTATSCVRDIEQNENRYRQQLLDKLISQSADTSPEPKAQFVFCIDVRSEPFRRSLEMQGPYETYGFAGFFGVPITIKDKITDQSYDSCPVLLSPKHTVNEGPGSDACARDRKNYLRVTNLKRFYQSVKYTFTAPFALVETLGPLTGIWMALRSFTPHTAESIKQKTIDVIRPKQPVATSICEIAHHDQCAYALSALKIMGLTQRFAPLVVLCGHGSISTNNAFATALDCGACGGNHGAGNARVLADILNQHEVRLHLLMHNIVIPEKTLFIAAEHNTTTDEVMLYTTRNPLSLQKAIADIKEALKAARRDNNIKRALSLGSPDNEMCSQKILERSRDWAQVRPEWGLARNASFIVAPRYITRNVDLNGRSFLHSYDWQRDEDGASLTTILTAPMVVAQWINCQYLFSTLNNVAYGAGSKVTKNITGKIGVMQGNASDLMHGLPLQSVYQNDNSPYHEPMRLQTIVYAPLGRLQAVIESQPVLQKLFGNGWVIPVCIDPEQRKTYILEKGCTWKIYA